jgi:hypothetical protein
MSHREVTVAFGRMISCGLLRVFRSVSLPGLGGYIATGYKFDPVVMNAKLPLEFFEARNAVRIAQSEGAEKCASDSYQHAVRLMNHAALQIVRSFHEGEVAAIWG